MSIQSFLAGLWHRETSTERLVRLANESVAQLSLDVTRIKVAQGELLRVQSAAIESGQTVVSALQQASGDFATECQHNAEARETTMSAFVTEGDQELTSMRKAYFARRDQIRDERTEKRGELQTAARSESDAANAVAGILGKLRGTVTQLTTLNEATVGTFTGLDPNAPPAQNDGSQES